MPTLHKFITAFIVALSPLITAADAITDYATGKCGANLLTVVHDHCQPASIPSADDYATLLPQIYDVDDATLLPDFLAANAVVGSAPMRSDCAIPASWFNKSNPAASIVGADLHNIFPTTYANRNARADLPLMASTSANVGIGRTSDDKYTVYQPADRYKGAIARMVFYVAAIYMKSSAWQGNGAIIFDDFTTYPLLSKRALSQYIAWHKAYPVDADETARSRRIEARQGNINPFVIYPQLVDHIWGDLADVPFIPTATPDDDGGGGGGEDPSTPDNPDTPSNPIPLHAVYSSGDTIYLYSPYVDTAAAWTIDGNTVTSTSINASELATGAHELRFSTPTTAGKLIITIKP